MTVLFYLLAIVFLFLSIYFFHPLLSNSYLKGKNKASIFQLFPEGAKELTIDQVSTGVAASLGSLNKKVRLAIHHVWASEDRSYRIYLSIWGDLGTDVIAERMAQATGARTVKIAPESVKDVLPRISHFALVKTNMWLGGSRPDVEVSDLSESLGDEFARMHGDAVLTVTCRRMTNWRNRKYVKWFQETSRKLDRNQLYHHPHSSPSLLQTTISAGAVDDDVSGLLSLAVNKINRYDFDWKIVNVNDLLPLTLIVIPAILDGLIAYKYHLPTLFYILSIAMALTPITVEVITVLLGGAIFESINSYPYVRALKHGLGHLGKSGRSYLSRRSHVNEELEGGGGRSSVISRYPPVNKMILAPSQLAPFIVSPAKANFAAGSFSSLQKAAPPIVVNTEGVRIGVDPQGYAVRISDRDRVGGTIAIGDPGSGKTIFTLGVWGGDLYIKKYGLPSATTSYHDKKAMIWFETKGEGADRAMAVAKQIGYDEVDVLKIDLSNSGGIQLNLLPGDDIERNATEIVDAMTYALEEGSIMEHSRQILISAFTLALCADDEMLDHLFKGKDPNLIKLVYLLMGASRSKQDIVEDGESSTSPQKQLFDYYVRLSRKNPNDKVLQGAVEAWDYWMSQDQRSRDQALSAPLNKIRGLAAIEQFWSFKRSNGNEISFDEILQQKRTVILNFGAGQATETTSRRFAAMSLHLIWQAIKRQCDNWSELNNSVTLYADELSDISGTGSQEDVIAAMRDAGRSRGVRLVLATQRYSQLPNYTLQAIMSFSTKVYLATENRESAEKMIQDLVGEDKNSYTVDDIRGLKTREALVRTRVNQEVQPPFSMKVLLETAVKREGYLEKIVEE